MDDARDLLTRLDEVDSQERQEVETRLVAMGDSAIDDILESIHGINGRMNGAIPTERLDPEKEVLALERRIGILSRMRNPKTLKAVFDALADSAIAVDQCKNESNNLPYDFQFIVHSRLVAAESLLKTASEALVNFGEIVIPHARRYSNEAPPPVKKALRKVLAKLEKKRWQFWK